MLLLVMQWMTAAGQVYKYSEVHTGLLTYNALYPEHAMALSTPTVEVNK